MKELAGKTVYAVRLNDDKDFIVFECENGDTVAYSAEGDCCSHSWIEHLNGLSELLGKRVNRIVEREMPEMKRGEYEYIQSYGWTLETETGRCDIEMRNESNGYYGGWLQYQPDLTAIKDQYHRARRGLVMPYCKLIEGDF